MEKRGEKMKKYQYDISVIIPVYNNEKYVEECITSVLKQSFDPQKIQMVLINDGSKDKSLEIIQKYKGENVVIIDKENTGVSDTRNIGMQHALGKYILFLDSDDALSEETCKNLFHFFEKHYDEIDLVTYPIIYNVNGNLKPHVRYSKMFEKGTAVYDLEENYTLIQATVNIMIKNRFDKNFLFAVDQNFSEDERFATEIVMQKKKIGFCNDASYIYRRHVGTANDTITKAYYSFETITSYYEYLFDRYKVNGHVPKYIQTLYVNNLSWRIKQDDLLPYHYEKKEYKRAMDRIVNLVSQLDNEVILALPYMNIFHKVYLLKLKKENFNITVEQDGTYTVCCGSLEIVKRKNIPSTIYRFFIKDDQLILYGNLNTILYEDEKPNVYLDIQYKNNTEKEERIDTFLTNYSYYESKMKTNTIYGYKISIHFRDVKEFKLYTKVNGIKIPLLFNFNKFTSHILYDKKLCIDCNKKKFKIRKNTIFLRVKDSARNIFKYGKKNYKIVLYRFLAKTYPKKQPIWLYYDNGRVPDNGCVQFKHDFKKKDGVLRFYVYDDDYGKIKKHFSREEQKYLLKFKTLKHKKIFLRCDKILTSFTDLQVYCPFNNGIEWYTDIKKYELIYLQHGILHANLRKMYSKEFTEISKFVISTEFEEKNLIQKYNYEKHDFIKSGMPRMQKKNKLVEQKNKILFAPSWRQYLIGNLVKGKRDLKIREFLNSSFFKETYDLLHSKKLQSLLKTNHFTLDFKLHPIFKEYAKFYELEHVENVHMDFGETNIEEYKIFITDFSSFQFDFVLLKRPILYFVPDKVEFDAGLHTYRELDLEHKDAFGNLYTKAEALLEELSSLIQQGCKPNKKYEKRMEEFFLLINNPCEKIYRSLRK